ncbi:MAG: hypothetical protein WKG01_41725 [Kofleriaceae bacterium]
MPTTTEPDSFVAISPDRLETVAGGASRTPSSSGNSEVMSALNAITSSLKDLAGSKNSGGDPMQMMLMMIMLGGMGGGGGGGYAVAPAGPPVINVDTGVSGGGCRPRGKKGW